MIVELTPIFEHVRWLTLAAITVGVFHLVFFLRRSFWVHSYIVEKNMPTGAPRYTKADFQKEREATPFKERSFGVYSYLWLLGVSLVVGATVVAWAHIIYAFTTTTPAARGHRVAVAVEESYGVKLSDSQGAALLAYDDLATANPVLKPGVAPGFIPEWEPASNFELYGETQIRENGKTVTIHLAWVDGEYVILAGDPVEMVELSH